MQLWVKSGANLKWYTLWCYAENVLHTSLITSSLESVCCLQKIGDSMIDSIIGENIPILTEQEKFNETITSSVKRLESSLTGKPNSYFRDCFRATLPIA